MTRDALAQEDAVLEGRVKVGRGELFAREGLDPFAHFLFTLGVVLGGLLISQLLV